MDDAKKALALTVKATLFSVNNAVRTYEQAAFKASSRVERKFFEALVEDKKNHYKCIQRFYQYVNKNKDIEELFSEIEQQIMEKNHSFSAEFIEKINAQKEEIAILPTVIEQEKKSINDYHNLLVNSEERLLSLFYQMMYDFVSRDFKKYFEIFTKQEECEEEVEEELKETKKYRDL